PYCLPSLYSQSDVRLVNFFFSSRRRHTSCYRDWSSDVCSSDLDSSPAAFAPTGSDHRHPERGGCSAIELSIRSPRAGETKGYLSGQNPADYWSPGMERCPSHSGVSEPVRDRGNFSRDERPPHWRLVAAAPLDRQQDTSPRLVLHDCGAAPSAAVAASTPSRFAL